MAEAASQSSTVASHAQDKSASHAGQVSSSIGSRSSTFDYHNTQPLPGFNPPSPYQYFTQLNDILGNGKSTTTMNHAPSLQPVGGLSPALPPSGRTPARGNAKTQLSTNAAKAYERSLMSDSDKRQIVQNLSDYIRVFCGAYKGRFLLQDIEQLILDPVIIKPEKYDTVFAQRRQLVGCLLDYFKSGRVHPLHWFDVITSWKGGHKRVMTYQEFVIGFQRYCEELCYSTWQEDDLEKVFQFLLRSPQSPFVRRQDFRFAMRRHNLTKRKAAWINKQARMIKKLRKFISRIHANFSDFCPSTIIRKRGKTINLHELESTLFLILTDLVIFLNCRNADELLNKHSMNLSKSQRRRRHGIPVEFRKTGEGVLSLEEMSSGDEMSTQDSLEDMSVVSQDDGSVGSLLSQTSQSRLAESGASASSASASSASLPRSPSRPSPVPTAPTMTAGEQPLFKAKKDAPGAMVFTHARKSFAKPLFVPDPDHPSNVRGEVPAFASPNSHTQSVTRMTRSQSRRTGSRRYLDAASESDTSVSPPGSSRANGHSLSASPSRNRILSRATSRQPLAAPSFSAPAVDVMRARGPDSFVGESSSSLPSSSPLAREGVETVRMQAHLANHLQPEELEYLRSLVVQVGTPPAKGGAAGQVRGRGGGGGGSVLPRGEGAGSSFLGRRPSVLSGLSTPAKRHSIVRRHSIIQRYTVIHQSKNALSPTSAAAAAALAESSLGVDDDWDERYLGVGSRRPTALEAGISVGMAQAGLHGDDLHDVDADELAAFERCMEERKMKLAREFKNVTDHFDRRINLARNRLHQHL